MYSESVIAGLGLTNSAAAAECLLTVAPES